MTPIGALAGWLAVGSAVLLLAGCGGGSSGSTASTAPTGDQLAQGKRSLGLADRFLYEHNASEFGGRTFRWVPPIPIYLLTGDPPVDAVLVSEAQAWEAPLAAVTGAPFYQPLGLATSVPPRGIFFVADDLPGEVIGFGYPFIELAQGRRGAGARLLAQVRAAGAAGGRRELPEVLADGRIQRCVVVLDPSLADANDTVIRFVLRHEIGHCLGFVGHVSSGLMRPTCCPLNLTPDVVGMMQKLYSLPPGTAVTP